MKYLKTFENLKDFYMSDRKFVVVTEDEKYVISELVRQRLFIFPISILDTHSHAFLVDEIEAIGGIWDGVPFNWFTQPGLLSNMLEGGLVNILTDKADMKFILKSLDKNTDHSFDGLWKLSTKMKTAFEVFKGDLKFKKIYYDIGAQKSSDNDDEYLNL